MLLWDVLETAQTQSYEQAVAVLEDLLAMEANAPLNKHYSYPGEKNILLDSVRIKSLV